MANLNELSDEELNILEQELNALEEPKVAPSRPRKRQGNFSNKDLEAMSDEELNMLEQELNQLEQTQEPEEPGIFGRVGQGIQDFVSENITNPEQSPFEAGLSESIRDFGIPTAAAPFEFFDFLAGAGGKAGQKISEFVGLDTQDIEISRPFSSLSTENMQEIFDDFTDGKFKVTEEEKKTLKGKQVEGAKEFARDVALLLNPATPGKMKMLRGIGTAVAGVLVPKGLIHAGIIDEGNKDIAKLGTWIMSSFIKPGEMKKAATRLFNRSEKAMGDTIITDPKFVNELQALRKELTQAGGDTLRANKPAAEIIESILVDVESGTFEGKLIKNQMENINALIRETGGINSKAAPALSKARGVVQNAAERFGVNSPEYIDNLNEGNLLWSGIHAKNGITNWVTKNLDKKLLSGLGDKAATSVGLAKIGGKILASPFKPITKIADFLDRVRTNPAARNFYLDFIMGALERNQKTAQEALIGLDKELQGSEGKTKRQKKQKAK